MDKPLGHFITLEGLDGCGKSTQIELAAGYLRRRGHTVLATREPGGTLLGQRIRELLLRASGEPITPLTELSLMFAARSQHIEQVILPALRQGSVVLCDRFTDSSVAYQGYGRGVALETIRALETLLCHGLRPHLTLVLDIDVPMSIDRTGARNRAAQEPGTRFEQEDQRFFERVREGYLALARDEPRRVRCIDGRNSVEAVQAAIQAEIDGLLKHSRTQEQP